MGRWWAASPWCRWILWWINTSYPRWLTTKCKWCQSKHKILDTTIKLAQTNSLNQKLTFKRASSRYRLMVIRKIMIRCKITSRMTRRSNVHSDKPKWIMAKIWCQATNLKDSNPNSFKGPMVNSNNTHWTIQQTKIQYTEVVASCHLTINHINRKKGLIVSMYLSILGQQSLDKDRWVISRKRTTEPIPINDHTHSILYSRLVLDWEAVV